jgi:hypothetical protein
MRQRVAEWMFTSFTRTSAWPRSNFGIGSSRSSNCSRPRTSSIIGLAKIHCRYVLVINTSTGSAALAGNFRNHTTRPFLAAGIIPGRGGRDSFCNPRTDSRGRTCDDRALRGQRSHAHSAPAAQQSSHFQFSVDYFTDVLVCPGCVSPTQEAHLDSIPCVRCAMTTVSFTRSSSVLGRPRVLLLCQAAARRSRSTCIRDARKRLKQAEELRTLLKALEDHCKTPGRARLQIALPSNRSICG